MREFAVFFIGLGMTLFFAYLTGLIGLIDDDDFGMASWLIASAICGIEAVALMVVYGVI